MQKEDLISQAYCQMNADIYHNSKRSLGGGKHAEIVKQIAPKWDTKLILDYGCGQGGFKKAFDEFNLPIIVEEYDPSIKDKDFVPCYGTIIYDLIVCTDVLEHIEPDKIDAVLDHLFSLMDKAGYFVISLCETKVVLPDGRNAHVLLKPIEWWLEKFTKLPCEINHCSIRIKKKQTKDMVIWLTKK